jgi:hypothetical protein
MMDGYRSPNNGRSRLTTTSLDVSWYARVGKLPELSHYRWCRLDPKVSVRAPNSNRPRRDIGTAIGSWSASPARALPWQATIFPTGARVVRSLAALVMFAAASTGGAAAADCAGQPNLQEADGHWYYRIDRLNHRKCWYLQPQIQSAESTSADSKLGVTNAIDEVLSSLFSAGKGSFSIKSQRDVATGAKPLEPRDEPNARNGASATHHRRSVLDETRASTFVARPAQVQRSDLQRQENARQRDELFEDFLRWSMRRQ